MDVKLLAQKFYDYSSYMRGYTKYTIQRYKTTINYFCNYSGITEIEEIDFDKVRNFFYYGRTQRKWSSNSFITFHKSLVVFFRWCVKEGHMEKNFADDIEIPKLEKRLPPKLTRQEAMKILEVVYNYPYPYHFLRYRNHAIFTTFIFSGIRRRKLLNLKYADVDLENMSIFIRQGKGSKDRIVPICYKLASILQVYLKERARLNKTCPEFFASLNRDMRFTEIGLRRLTGKIRVATGLEFTIHKLRHTFATLMLEGGCDIYSLSRMMGHSDIKTTTIYLAASAEHLRSQIIKHPLNNLILA